MLAKSKISAYIMGFVFIAGIFSGSFALLRPLHPEPFFQVTPEILMVGGLIFCAIIVITLFFFSRSVWIMGLSESEGFGLRGLARWFACGFIIGGTWSAFWEFLHLLPNRPEANIFDYLFALIVLDLVKDISYWLVFGPHVEWLKRMDLPYGWNIEAKSIRWFLLVGALITLIVFWYWTIVGLGREPRFLWWSASGVILSLGALLIGLLFRMDPLKRFESRLKIGVYAMLGLASALFMIGLRA